MTVLDMRSGYYSISLDDESKPKTGFVTQRSVHQFKRLSMGLINSPMSYQMIMQDVLRNLHWKCALAYIDDVLVYSLGFQRHLKDLREVFERIRSAKLRIHPKKGQFATREVKYVGHVLSREGVKIDSSKTAAIAQMPTPKSVHDVRVFLGCTNFFRKYVFRHSQIAAPLTRLLRKDVEFVWTKECEEAFPALKLALTSAPVLKYPDFDKQFVLTCDASNMAIGYWLGQFDENKGLYAIAFGGRNLAHSERKFSVSNLECLAFKEGIEQFRIYLATGRFKVIMDHFSLQYLQSMRDMSGRLGRWSLYLQGYDFQIEYKAGKLNSATDFLSRIEYPSQAVNKKEQAQAKQGDVHVNDVCEDMECEQFYAEGVPTIAAVNSAVGVVGNAKDVCADSDMKAMQRQDEVLRQLVEYLDRGGLPEDNETARRIVVEAANYVIDNDVLYHFYYLRGKGKMVDRQVKQLVIPAAKQADVLAAFHESPIAAHQGAERMYAAM